MSWDEPLEWTAEEAEQFERLPPELEPDPGLEDRTIVALHRRGLLGGRPRTHSLRLVGAAAAASFFVGLLIGRAGRPAGNDSGSAIAAHADSSRATVTWIVGI